MSAPTTPARITEEEILALRKHHVAAQCEPGADPESDGHKAHVERSRYWRRLDQRRAERARTARVPSLFHAYTHDAEGNLVRLG